LDYKRTSPDVRYLSALPPKADIVQHGRDVRFVPKADSCSAAKRSLFDQLIGELPEIYRNVEAERFGSLWVMDSTTYPSIAALS
jgi:hypothetical protein